MSRCEEYQELISRMVDDELTARQKAALQDHIRTCEDCAALYSAFSALSKQIGEDLEDVPLYLRENVMAEIRREEIRRKNRIPTALRGILAAAACVAVIAGVSLGVSPRLRGRITAAAYPEMTKSAAVETAAEPAEEYAQDSADVERMFVAEEAAEIEEAVTTEEAPAEEAIAEEPKAVEPLTNADVQAAGTEAHADADEGTGRVDFSGWMDLALLRELLGGEPADLTREELGEDPSWTLRVKGEPEGNLVQVYVLDGLLYYWDPVEDAVYQAQLSPEEFETFLNS